MKYRSLPVATLPVACATLTFALGISSLIAPPVLRAQTPDSSESVAAETADQTADATSSTQSSGTETTAESTPTETTTETTTEATTEATTTETTTAESAPGESAPASASASSVRVASTEAVEAEVTEAAPANPEQTTRATGFIADALTIAEKNFAARLPVVRGAASLIPRADSAQREALASRWIRLQQSSSVPRGVRLDAYSAFFAAATQVNRGFARKTALQIPDAAARAGAFLTLSADDHTDWTRSVNYVGMAQRAARQETDATQRARVLTFIAYRLASLNPATREAAVIEASSNVRLLSDVKTRDNLLAELVGAAAKFDLALANRVASGISDADLKNLAQARINLAEISQTTITSSNADRVSALAKAAARYDVRAIPVLIQLPAQDDVLKAISDALPPIFPTARPAIESSLLEQIWNYAEKAPASTQKDSLQSRLARLMVTQDIWRGRTWGKSLTWKGGRIQVGAFIKDVLAARRTQVRAMPLQDVAKRNVDAAIAQAQNLAPVARAEALLLIAGQLLETPTS